MTCIFKKFIDLCDQTTGNKERLQGPRDFGATRELVDDSPNILENVTDNLNNVFSENSYDAAYFCRDTRGNSWT